jgi:hypothetical protein
MRLWPRKGVNVDSRGGSVSGISSLEGQYSASSADSGDVVEYRLQKRYPIKQLDRWLDYTLRIGFNVFTICLGTLILLYGYLLFTNEPTCGPNESIQTE